MHGREAPPEVPQIDPLHNLKPTPSMRATVKYFWVVTALFGLQVVLGMVTAHYAWKARASTASTCPRSCPTW
jgi:nitric oxide reductase subunit B